MSNISTKKLLSDKKTLKSPSIKNDNNPAQSVYLQNNPHFNKNIPLEEHDLIAQVSSLINNLDMNQEIPNSISSG